MHTMHDIFYLHINNTISNRKANKIIVPAKKTTNKGTIHQQLPAKKVNFKERHLLLPTLIFQRYIFYKAGEFHAFSAGSRTRLKVTFEECDMYLTFLTIGQEWDGAFQNCPLTSISQNSLAFFQRFIF